MRTKNKSTFFLFLFAFMFSVGVSAQTDPQEILDNVENPEDYVTIELIKMDPNLSIFVDLVEKSGMDVSMKIADEHTLLVPTNEAFGEMSAEKLTELMNPQNQAELVEFINYHVLPTEVELYQFEMNDIIDTQGEEEITVESRANGELIYIGGAEIIKPDIQAANGIIHIVDRWIEPNAEVLGQ